MKWPVRLHGQRRIGESKIEQMLYANGGFGHISQYFVFVRQQGCLVFYTQKFG